MGTVPLQGNRGGITAVLLRVLELILPKPVHCIIFQASKIVSIDSMINQYHEPFF